VQAIVTSDHSLYPTDPLGLRGNLIEALRRRGIYPTRAISLTDAALIWPRPDPLLRFSDGKEPVPLDELVLESSRNLDPDSTPGQRPEEVFGKLNDWAREHAVAIGLEPSKSLHVESVHVAYRQADDHQPRPELVVQLIQRRDDLEEIEQPHLPPEARTPLLAGTTLIARVDGEIQHIISKPLPLIDPASDEVSQYIHAYGKDRLDKIRSYFGEVSDADPLAIWTDEPAVSRLTFANLHTYDQEGA
jgi:hypothetical protein